ILGGVGSLAWWLGGAGTPERRGAVARGLIEGISVSATVGGSSLAATLAIADFGIEEGVRLVPVRILESIELELSIRSTVAVALAAPPRVCLVGPDSAPDDAGLSDRCWGDPDLSALLVAQLETDAAGHLALPADRPVTVTATIARGHERCDYPAGAWTLEIDIEPLVDGRAEGRFELPASRVEVPLEPSGTALRLVERGDSRYCGLASSVWREQGEPALIAP
ncbi:MAG: hypothetical protein AB1736_14575, partial [Chloroflexota bacterium]